MSKNLNKKKVVAFVPIKLNNERLPGKNTKSFENGKPLISYILSTLLQISLIDEVYVFCSNKEICNYLPQNVIFIERDPYLDLSTTKFNEVLMSFAAIVKADIYVLTHATAPFIYKSTFEKGINSLLNEEYDSAFSVLKMQEFLWDKDQPFNYDLENIPRTQDLKPLYMETCGMYIYTRDLIIEQKRRIGNNPFLVEVNKIEACDINEQEDFQLANAIYNTIIKPNE